MDKLQIADLIVEWVEKRDEGCILTAEELCSNHPQLVKELHGHIRKLTAMTPTLKYSPQPQDYCM